jgi:hypothetical protein
MLKLIGPFDLLRRFMCFSHGLCSLHAERNQTERSRARSNSRVREALATSYLIFAMSSEAEPQTGEAYAAVLSLWV